MKKWFSVELPQQTKKERMKITVFKSYLRNNNYTFDSCGCYENNLIRIYCTSEEAARLDKKLDRIEAATKRFFDGLGGLQHA